MGIVKLWTNLIEQLKRLGITLSEEVRASAALQNTVDYVCGNGEALPLPLSAEEEGASLKKLIEGEEVERERAKSLLIQHNLRLVVYIARKFDNTGVENDDLVSIGTIGLIKAVNSFRADKSIKLATLLRARLKELRKSAHLLASNPVSMVLYT